MIYRAVEKIQEINEKLENFKESGYEIHITDDLFVVSKDDDNIHFKWGEIVDNHNNEHVLRCLVYKDIDKYKFATSGILYNSDLSNPRVIKFEIVPIIGLPFFDYKLLETMVNYKDHGHKIHSTPTDSWFLLPFFDKKEYQSTLLPKGRESI